MDTEYPAWGWWLHRTGSSESEGWWQAQMENHP